MFTCNRSYMFTCNWSRERCLAQTTNNINMQSRSPAVELPNADTEKRKEDRNSDITKKKVRVAADSMMNQIDGNRLSKDVDVTVKCWGGCNIADMRNKINRELQNTSYDHVILHVGTNDSITKPSETMLSDIIQLKQYIESTYKTCVIISNLIGRTDDGKANFTIRNFNQKLSNLKIPIMDNSNITSKYLGSKGLHLSSPYGTGRLVTNLIHLIRRL